MHMAAVAVKIIFRKDKTKYFEKVAYTKCGIIHFLHANAVENFKNYDLFAKSKTPTLE